MPSVRNKVVILTMATSNINKKGIYNNKKTKPVYTALNKTCLIEQFYRHCFGTAIFLILFYL